RPRDPGAGAAGPPELRLVTLEGLPEVATGDDLGGLLATAAAAAGARPGGGLVVAPKGVGKAEGRGVRLAGGVPGPAATALAAETGKDPRLVEVILGESRRIVRRRGGTIICETHQGFVCANAGVDASNAPEGVLILLPRDADASARRLQAVLARRVGGRIGLVVSDTHGRAFRRGLVNVAGGVAGARPRVHPRGGGGPSAGWTASGGRSSRRSRRSRTSSRLRRAC